jgi:hypothetical protein
MDGLPYRFAYAKSFVKERFGTSWEKPGKRNNPLNFVQDFFCHSFINKKF